MRRERAARLRDVWSGAGVGISASATVLGVGLVLHGWDVGETAAYAWTHALYGLLGPLPLLAGALVLLFLVPFSYVAYCASACTLALPLIVAIFIEVGRFPTSHNLIPFELAGLALGSALLHLPSLTLAVIRSRSSSPDRRRLLPRRSADGGRT